MGAAISCVSLWLACCCLMGTVISSPSGLSAPNVSYSGDREFTLSFETSPAYVRYDSDLLLLSDFDVDGRSLTLSRLTAKH